MTWILATFTFVSILSVGGLIASNIYLIRTIQKKMLIEKAENLYEYKDAEEAVDPEIEALKTETVEVPAY
jgi:hypothetical protein